MGVYLIFIVAGLLKKNMAMMVGEDDDDGDLQNWREVKEKQ